MTQNGAVHQALTSPGRLIFGDVIWAERKILRFLVTDAPPRLNAMAGMKMANRHFAKLTRDDSSQGWGRERDEENIPFPGKQ